MAKTKYSNLPFNRYENTFELYSESERLYLFGTDDPDGHKEWVKSIAKVSNKHKFSYFLLKVNTLLPSFPFHLFFFRAAIHITNISFLCIIDAAKCV